MSYFNSAVKDLESNQAPVSLVEIISNSVTAVFTEQKVSAREQNSTETKALTSASNDISVLFLTLSWWQQNIDLLSVHSVSFQISDLIDWLD